MAFFESDAHTRRQNEEKWMEGNRSKVGLITRQVQDINRRFVLKLGGGKGLKPDRQNYVNILEINQTSTYHTCLGFYPEKNLLKISSVFNNSAENQTVDKRTSLAVRNRDDYRLTSVLNLFDSFGKKHF